MVKSNDNLKYKVVSSVKMLYGTLMKIIEISGWYCCTNSRPAFVQIIVRVQNADEMPAAHIWTPVPLSERLALTCWLVHTTKGSHNCVSVWGICSGRILLLDLLLVLSSVLNMHRIQSVPSICGMRKTISFSSSPTLWIRADLLHSCMQLGRISIPYPRQLKLFAATSSARPSPQPKSQTVSILVTSANSCNNQNSNVVGLRFNQ